MNAAHEVVSAACIAASMEPLMIAVATGDGVTVGNAGVAADAVEAHEDLASPKIEAHIAGP